MPRRSLPALQGNTTLLMSPAVLTSLRAMVEQKLLGDSANPYMAWVQEDDFNWGGGGARGGGGGILLYYNIMMLK